MVRRSVIRMHGLGRRALIALACAPMAATAQTGMSRAEAAQLYSAAGFPIANDRPVNRCGQPAKPRVTLVDINADRQPEALFIDADAACYAPEGRYFAVLTRTRSGWQLVASGNGTIEALPTRTSGWLDMRVSDAACARQLHFDGQRYAATAACGAATAGERPAAARPNAGPPTAPPPDAPTAAAPASTTGTKLSAADEAAVFKAAGFRKRGGKWRSDCDDTTATYMPGTIEQVADLNGDGRPDVVLTEGGTFCYGNTGSGYWLLSQRADGGWTLMDHNTGIPEFLATRGADGWPDLSVGGPGFCFPVQRWNGREYKLQRWQYEGKPCKPPR